MRKTPSGVSGFGFRLMACRGWTSFKHKYLRSMTGASSSRQVELSPSQPTLPGSFGTTIGREQFLILDGIRGVAALFVLMRHTYYMWGFNPFRSYLAVDLFFILSGFVIAHAYDRKLTRKQLSRRDFMLLRVIRLYPMYALSVVVCAGIFFRDLMITSENLSSIFVPGMLMFCFAIVFLPFHMIGYPELFPINYVFWSLFYELLVNGMYSAIRPRLSPWITVGILLIASVALVYAARQHGSLDLGSAWGIMQFVGGGARAVFGIFLGVVLYLRRAKLMSSLRLRAATYS
jgi:peptidoglycan/LPS O-acetylase OafA/YrhL